MTGDGVNDAPRSRPPMWASPWASAAPTWHAEAAALVLLDDELCPRIVAAIRQGRRIDDNLREAIRFTFAVHLPDSCAGTDPHALCNGQRCCCQYTWCLLQLLIDPTCAVVLEAEPEAPGLMERAPRAVGDSQALPWRPWAMPWCRAWALQCCCCRGHALAQCPRGQCSAKPGRRVSRWCSA